MTTGTPESAVLLVGNVVDGLSVVGPFDNGELAHEYADQYLDGEWTCVGISTPTPLDPGEEQDRDEQLRKFSPPH